MICTEQERDALMAAVEQFGIQKMAFGLADPGSVAEQLADDKAWKHYDAIRAMLAPPDDAGLRDRIAKAAYSAWWNYEKSPEPWHRVADAVLSVLQCGEATRDE